MPYAEVGSDAVLLCKVSEALSTPAPLSSCHSYSPGTKPDHSFSILTSPVQVCAVSDLCMFLLPSLQTCSASSPRPSPQLHLLIKQKVVSALPELQRAISVGVYMIMVTSLVVWYLRVATLSPVTSLSPVSVTCTKT